MKVSPGADQARDTPGSPRPRELTLIEALRAQRLLNQRARQRVDGPAFVVWSVLLDSTLGFQSTRATHFHAHLAAEANVTTKTVSRAIKTLVSAGLIEYQPGYASEGLGRNLPSQFTVRDVGEVLTAWAENQGEKGSTGVPPRQGVPPGQSPPVPPSEGAPSSPARGHGPDSPDPTVPPEESTYRGENVTGKYLMGENSGVGVQVVRSTPAAHPAPNDLDAQAVLDAYCAWMAERGTPVIKPAPLLAPIREAITAGYSAQMVLIGLGMWDAEGFRTTRQVGEWVEKAGREGPLPTGQHSVAELLEEGRRRYAHFLARKNLSMPSKADQRRLRSMRAMQEFASEG